MLRFTLFGFPVTIHWMFFVVLAILGGGLNAETPDQFQRLLLWVLAGSTSVLIHELGHAFLMRNCGARVAILLQGLQGLAIPDRAFPWKQDILISLAGPGVQIAAGLIARWLLAVSSGDEWYVTSFLESFYEVSIVWSVINLLPIFPLDGGHVLRSALGPPNWRMTLIISIVAAVSVGVFVLLASYTPSLARLVPSPFNHYLAPFNALMVGFLAYSNFQRLQSGAQN